MVTFSNTGHKPADPLSRVSQKIEKTSRDEFLAEAKRVGDKAASQGKCRETAVNNWIATPTQKPR